MNSSFLCDIGDGQNLSENLSTFSAHIANVLDILRRINGESLVIMDRIGMREQIRRREWESRSRYWKS